MATKTKSNPKSKVASPKAKVVENLHMKSAAELATAAKEARAEIARMAMSVRVGKEKNTRMIFNLRKTLARTLSVIREKELELKA